MFGLQEKFTSEDARETPLALCSDTVSTGMAQHIVKIQALNSPTRFLGVSETWEAVTYNSQFQISNTIQLRHVPAEAQVSQGKAPTIKRVTDAVMMKNAWRICVATTARELQFFHASSGMLVYTVVTPNIVT